MVIVIVVFIVSLTMGMTARGSSLDSLEADAPPRLLHAAPGSKLTFELRGLESGLSYEVLVSYPATHPAHFRLSLLGDSFDTGRHLLNTDKILFVARPGLSVLVEIMAEGVPHPSHQRDSLIPFHLRVSRTVLGGVPQRSLPVIMVAVLIVLGAFARLVGLI